MSNDTTTLKQAAQYIRAVNHKLRQSIIAHLRETGGSNVTTIYEKLRIEQSVASQHLAILRRHNIVTVTPTGKERIYTVNEERIIRLYQDCLNLIAEPV